MIAADEISSPEFDLIIPTWIRLLRIRANLPGGD
jgi:hypothetical protein